MIPMGTVVTVSMFAGLLVVSPFSKILKIPQPVAKGIGVLLLAAGCWNVLWYSLQHLSEFWGQAALVSGLLMILTASYILAENRLPLKLRQLKPVVLIGLLGCGLTYAITIARL